MTDAIIVKDDTMAGPPPVAGVGPLVAGTMPPPPAPRPHSGSGQGEVVELVTESGSRLVHYPNPQKTPRPPAPRMRNTSV